MDTPQDHTGSAPRIEPVVDPDEEVRDLLARTLLHDGEPLHLFSTLARHPRLMSRFNVLGGFFLTRGTLAPRDRELVILRVAWRTRSVYEWGQHVLIGADAGLDPDEIRAVTTSTPHDPWGPSDAALLTFTDELLAATDVSDPTWAAVAAFLDERQLLELVCLVGFYRMISGVLRAVGVQPETHLPGWPEDADGR